MLCISELSSTDPCKLVISSLMSECPCVEHETRPEAHVEKAVQEVVYNEDQRMVNSVKATQSVATECMRASVVALTNK